MKFIPKKAVRGKLSPTRLCCAFELTQEQMERYTELMISANLKSNQLARQMIIFCIQNSEPMQQKESEERHESHPN